jgi:hypothetical protein
LILETLIWIVNSLLGVTSNFEVGEGFGLKITLGGGKSYSCYSFVYLL